MSELKFNMIAARSEAYAAVPTISFQLQIDETSGDPIHQIALRCQVQIEPRRRRYSSEEQARMLDLFGEPARWGDTLRTLLWTHIQVMVPGFEGTTRVDLPMTCTYDFEVVAAKYFHALEDGEIPLLFQFSGTVYSKGENGFSIGLIPWEKEVSFRLPVAMWRETMDRFFPGTAWLRLRRDNFDALHRFKAERALTGWDEAIEALLKEAGA